MTIRMERDEDREAIHRVHAAAFPTEAEANLVDQLRAAGRTRLSLVGTIGDEIVGHILFSTATVGAVEGLALAPLAVLPSHQNRKLGTMLVAGALEACRRISANFVIVLGHPTYYPRFGFRKASESGIRNEFGADDAFMIIVLNPSVMPMSGIAQYAPAFADLE